MKLALELILFSVLSNLFAIVHSAEPQQEVDECRKACITDFIPLMHKFADTEPTRDELENILKYINVH